jgi:hypothetical protein
VSELCQMPPEIPVKQRDLRGHSDAHRCSGKSLMESALVRFGVRQHAWTDSLSKRAPSTTRTSLRLESMTYELKIEPKVFSASIVPQPSRRLHRFYPAMASWTRAIVMPTSDIVAPDHHLAA